MPVVESSTEPFAKQVRIKYVPIAENYKRTPLACSTTSGEGKHVSVKLQPGVWTKVPVEIAQDLLKQVRKSKRNKMVPDGTNLELQMEQGVHNERLEMAEPDYEIIVDGNI